MNPSVEKFLADVKANQEEKEKLQEVLDRDWDRPTLLARICELSANVGLPLTPDDFLGIESYDLKKALSE